jgi:phosphoglycerate dehydrogenase-like enzyme
MTITTSSTIITLFTSIATIAPALRDLQASQQQQQQQQQHDNNSPPLLFEIREIVDVSTWLLKSGNANGGDDLDDTVGVLDRNNSNQQPQQQRHLSLSETSIQWLQEAEILITEPHLLAQLLLWQQENNHKLLVNLKWCQSTYAGVDPIFRIQEQLERKSKTATTTTTTNSIPSSSSSSSWPPSFILTRFAGVFGRPMAEWCIGRIIERERNFVASHQDQSNRHWAATRSQISQYRYLSELTLAVLGATGDIGKCICQAAQALEMTVVKYSSQGRENATTNNLAMALQQADYIVSVLPSTPQTRGLLTLAALQVANPQQGGKSPVLINVGRGDLISTSTLLQAIHQKHLSGAILDVTEQEPLPPDSPLWIHPQVIISPHVSALTRGRDVPQLILQQLYRYQQDPNSLHYMVDWNRGY